MTFQIINLYRYYFQYQKYWGEMCIEGHIILYKKILNNHQYGFREKHSTINAVTALICDIIKVLEKDDIKSRQIL